jgi:hypothetical protein
MSCRHSLRSKPIEALIPRERRGTRGGGRRVSHHPDYRRRRPSARPAGGAGKLEWGWGDGKKADRVRKARALPWTRWGRRPQTPFNKERRMRHFAWLTILALSSAAQAHPARPRAEALPPAAVPAPTTTPYLVSVDANPAHVLNQFSPLASLRRRRRRRAHSRGAGNLHAIEHQPDAASRLRAGQLPALHRTLGAGLALEPGRHVLRNLVARLLD